MRKPIPLGYALQADAYLSREAMAAILAKHPMLRPATRALLLAGQATLSLDGTRFLAPAAPVAPGATHTARFNIDHVSTAKKGPPCTPS